MSGWFLEHGSEEAAGVRKGKHNHISSQTTLMEMDSKEGGISIPIQAGDSQIPIAQLCVPRSQARLLLLLLWSQTSGRPGRKELKKRRRLLRERLEWRKKEG